MAHAPEHTPGIGLHDVTLGYDGHPAVHHLSCAIAPGTLMAVVGPNGAGKSTLVKALAGLLQPIGGRIVWQRAQILEYIRLDIPDLFDEFGLRAPAAMIVQANESATLIPARVRWVIHRGSVVRFRRVIVVKGANDV